MGIRQPIRSKKTSAEKSSFFQTSLRFPNRRLDPCEIYVGSYFIFQEKFSLFLSQFHVKRAFIIADRSLDEARSALSLGLIQAGWKVHEIPVQAGESLKDFSSIYPLYGDLLRANAHRDSVIFALGGGSVGDAVGFVASTYLRGVAWVSVPTTLLAQVDSSVGGKTAVNHPSGKNLIGSFHQPRVVLCDVSFLRSLSERELVSGLGEALKVALVFDPGFLKYLMKNWRKALDQDLEVLSRIVKVSLKWKSLCVSRDEFDMKGLREKLNFGHTLGHALEEATHFQIFQHGEAVIWGIRFALILSEVVGEMSSSVRRELDRFLSSLPVPAWPKKMTLTRLLIPLQKDKKVKNDRLHFILLKKPGVSLSRADVTQEQLQKAFTLLTKNERSF